MKNLIKELGLENTVYDATSSHVFNGDEFKGIKVLVPKFIHLQKTSSQQSEQIEMHKYS